MHPDAVWARPRSLARDPVATGRPRPGQPRPRARKWVIVSVNAPPRKSINLNYIGDGAASDLSIVRPAPPRRPEPVEQHRAGRNHSSPRQIPSAPTHAPRDKENQPESERPKTTA